VLDGDGDGGRVGRLAVGVGDDPPQVHDVAEGVPVAVLAAAPFGAGGGGADRDGAPGLAEDHVPEDGVPEDGAAGGGDSGQRPEGGLPEHCVAEDGHESPPQVA